MLNTLREKIQYNIKHRNAVLKVERQCRGYNTLLCRIHDLDKLIMMILFIPDKWISKIHRTYSWHHVENKIGWLNIEEAVLDWESARYTKPDKPLNARETCRLLYPSLLGEVLHKCDEWNI